MESEIAPGGETPAPSAKELIKQAYAERPPTSGEEKQRELDTAVETIRDKRATAPPHLDTPDLTIGYKAADGVSYDSTKQVSAREAGRDLAQWRERARADVLRELGEAEAAEAAATPPEPQQSSEQPAPEQPAADPGLTREQYIQEFTNELAEATKRGEPADSIVARKADELIASAQTAYRAQEAALAQQVQADRNAAIGAATHYRDATETYAQLIQGMLLTEMPGVRTPADVAALPPAQQQRFAQLDAAYMQVKSESQRQQQQISAVQAQMQAHEAQAREVNFQSYKAQQNKLIEQQVPELAPGHESGSPTQITARRSRLPDRRWFYGRGTAPRLG